MVRGETKVIGRQLIAFDFPVIQLGDHRRRMQRHFIHPAAVNHRSTLVAQHAQGFGNRQHQFRAVDANQRQRRMCRVNQRPEHVEQRAGFQLLANRHRMAETGVILRRKQEADAQFIQRGAGLVGIHIQVDTERRQQIGRARLARYAAVAVFGDFQAAGRGHKGAGGRNVDAVAAVAAGTDDIGEQVIRARERRGVFQQGGCGAGNLLRLFTAHFHAHQRGSQLLGFHLATHHRREQQVALLLAQGFRLIQLLEDRLNHVGLLEFLQRPCQGLLQQTCALGGENRLRMELEAADAVGIMTHRHDHPVKVGVNGQPGRNIAAHQRVITRYRQRIGQPGKHRLAVMFDAGGFAVQDFASLADVAAVSFNNGLMTEADTDDRQFAAHPGQQLRHAARFAGGPRARREHQHRIIHGTNALN